MNWSKDITEKLERSTISDCEQRQAPRVHGRLNIMFSGMDATGIVMDTGTACDLCPDGIGLRTERALKPGMELALIIESPGLEEDICIPDARVTWVKENRVGLSIRTIKSDDRHRLQAAFSSTSFIFNNNRHEVKVDV